MKHALTAHALQPLSAESKQNARLQLQLHICVGNAKKKKTRYSYIYNLSGLRKCQTNTFNLITAVASATMNTVKQTSIQQRTSPPRTPMGCNKTKRLTRYYRYDYNSSGNMLKKRLATVTTNNFSGKMLKNKKKGNASVQFCKYGFSANMLKTAILQLQRLVQLFSENATIVHE